MHIYYIFCVYIVKEKALLHDNSLSLSTNSLSEENVLPINLTLQTNILQENRFDEEHVKHLSMSNTGMSEFGLLFYLGDCQHLYFACDTHVYQRCLILLLLLFCVFTHLCEFLFI